MLTCAGWSIDRLVQRASLALGTAAKLREEGAVRERNDVEL